VGERYKVVGLVGNLSKLVESTNFASFPLLKPTADPSLALTDQRNRIFHRVFHLSDHSPSESSPHSHKRNFSLNPPSTVPCQLYPLSTLPSNSILVWQQCRKLLTQLPSPPNFNIHSFSHFLEFDFRIFEPTRAQHSPLSPLIQLSPLVPPVLEPESLEKK